jgi:hypothetical protein
MYAARICAKALLLPWLFAVGALALAGCGGGAGGQGGIAAGLGTPPGPPVPAPTLAVGDRWQYRITDNLRRGAVTMLDAQVISIANGVATLRLVYSDPQGRSERTEEIDANGGLVTGTLKEEPTRRFPTPIELYDFPLQAGTSWRQTVNTTGPDTGLPAQILVYGTVQGPSQVSVPAGSYDATYLFRVIQLDDEQFWRSRTDRRDFVWYAPQVKTAVRETHDATYVLRGGGALSVVRTENTTRDLVSFQPGTH